MSVLNQSGEEQVECPLCMEPLEVDDLNFYPCTCGYQICRFCWHRIRTDENGLCPACRKAYSENPADFTPLSKEQVAQLKAEKRQRDQQRKAKLSESRKHLAAVRVVQKNLVFVVGLPVRLADADMLKRHEYFGKFGKIHKVVINQSTSYAGSQGPSASAYVTYVKSDDALRAIQSVNNIMLDGRLIKSSLGTTKYCSHFMKNQPCPKADCMYLHDFGDPEASFTKEQMHVGKHQEYEKKLHDSLQSRAVQQQQQQTSQQSSGAAPSGDKTTTGKASGGQKDANWPTLHSNGDTTNGGFGNNNKTEKQQKTETKSEKSQKKSNQKTKNNNNNTNSPNNNTIENTKQQKAEKNSSKNCEQTNCSSPPPQITTEESSTHTPSTPSPPAPLDPPPKIKETPTVEPTASDCIENLSKIQLLDDNTSFFSHNTFQKILPEDSSSYSTDSSSATPHSNILNDNLPDISSSEDWQAAFGFSNLKSERITENGFSPNENGFVSQPYHRENILDVLSGRNFLPERNPYINLNQNGLKPPENCLDQQMSKFFAEFTNTSNKNGFNHQTNGFLPTDRQNFLNLAESQHHNMLLLNYQQKLEDQAVYNLKQNVFHNQFVHNHQFVPNGEHFIGQNGQGGFPGVNFAQNSVFQSQLQHRNQLQQRNPLQMRGRESVDDELGFDPFHETQKALAELIESEQGVSQIQNSGLLNQPPSLNPAVNGTGTVGGAAPGSINGLLPNSASTTCGMPPPPPGFMQHNAHMNSFGSKILPFLNMSSSQQVSTSSGWSTNYSEAQLKGLAPVNDWMTLDPAIVSSSRHFPLANLQIRDQFPPNLFPNQTQNQRSFDFPHSNSHPNGFSPAPHTVQSFANSYAHLNSHTHTHSQSNGLNWFNMNGDAHVSVTSPPGFRQNAPTQSKTQEC